MLFFNVSLLLSSLALSIRPSLSTPTLVVTSTATNDLCQKCTQVVFPVTISVKNADFSFAVTTLLDLFELAPMGSTLASLFNLVAHMVNLPFTAVSSGTYNIAGTYCEPEVDVPSRRDIIQFLAHPATYDRNYWFGGNHPGVDGTRYSWVSYASKLGYPTFASDRLGNGFSDHPNSITTVQCPAQAAIVHELVKLARSGVSPFPRQFCNFIFVGESLGSIVGNFVNVNYPDDFNSTILGGFSKFWANAVPGKSTSFFQLYRNCGALASGAHGQGTYGFLNDDLGYLIANSLAGIEYFLFFGPGQYYDPSFIALDYTARGTITIGEAITGALGISVAEEYTGSVLVLTGNRDVVFCGTLDLPIDGPGNCNGSGILEETRTLYPRARPYSWFSLDNSGHCWQHHYTAQTGFKYAYDWLAQQGFGEERRKFATEFWRETRQF